MFTFQQTEILVFTTVKSPKLGLMSLKIRLRNQERQKPFLVEMVHIVLQGRQVAT